jgi:hypothetical protein
MPRNQAEDAFNVIEDIRFHVVHPQLPFAYKDKTPEQKIAVLEEQVQTLASMVGQLGQLIKQMP